MPVFPVYVLLLQLLCYNSNLMKMQQHQQGIRKLEARTIWVWCRVLAPAGSSAQIHEFVGWWCQCSALSTHQASWQCKTEKCMRQLYYKQPLGAVRLTLVVHPTRIKRQGWCSLVQNAKVPPHHLAPIGALPAVAQLAPFCTNLAAAFHQLLVHFWLLLHWGWYTFASILHQCIFCTDSYIQKVQMLVSTNMHTKKFWSQFQVGYNFEAMKKWLAL